MNKNYITLILKKIYYEQQQDPNFNKYQYAITLIVGTGSGYTDGEIIRVDNNYLYLHCAGGHKNFIRTDHISAITGREYNNRASEIIRKMAEELISDMTVFT